MGHKTLIGGAVYEIKGGKTLIGGTAYDIKGGKTLIGGTAYDINFAPPREQTIEALMASASLKYIAGRNTSSQGTPALTITTSGTYYVFAFNYGYMSVNKVVYSGIGLSKTIISQMSTSNGNIYIGSGGNLYYSSGGSATSTAYGATLAAFQFNGYTEAEADAIFTAATYTRRAGRNVRTTGNVGGNGTFSDPATLFIATNNLVAFSTVAINEDDVVYYSNCADNPSMATAPGAWGSGSTIYLSIATNKERASVYGASIIEVA